MPVCTGWWRACIYFSWRCRQPGGPHGTSHPHIRRQSTDRDSVHEAWIQCETSLYHSIVCIYMISFAVYYSLYTEDGEIKPKHPINRSGDDSPSVACIDKYLLPPPHSPESIIRSISYVEGFSYCVWHRLFVGVTSESPINYREIWIPESGGPGTTPDIPLIFVKFDTTRHTVRLRPYHYYIRGLWQSYYENSATVDPILQYTVQVLRGSQRPSVVHFPSTPTVWFAEKNWVSAMLAPEG